MAKVLRQIDDEAIERPFDKRQFFRLLSYMKPYKGRVAVALMLMVITTLCSLGQTFLLSRAVGLLQAETPLVPWQFVLGMAGMAIVIAVCTRLRVRLMDYSGRRALATLRQDLFDHIQTLSFSFFDTRSVGKIQVRVINDVNSLTCSPTAS